MESYTWAAFDLIRNVPEQYLDNALYKLGERLFENRQALAFHQCVVDEPIAKCGWPVCEGRRLRTGDVKRMSYDFSVVQVLA